MTPLETLTNIGKFFGYVAIAMFLFLSVIGQATYWFRGKKTAISSFPKHYKFLCECAKWECWVLGVGGALYVVVALTRVLWLLVVAEW